METSPNNSASSNFRSRHLFLQKAAVYSITGLEFGTRGRYLSAYLVKFIVKLPRTFIYLFFFLMYGDSPLLNARDTSPQSEHLTGERRGEGDSLRLRSL